MSYFPTDIPFMSDEELIENGLKKPEIINSKDLVPVVRCEDCKHLVEARGGLFCVNGYPARIMKPDDFCSYGERKE